MFQNIAKKNLVVITLISDEEEIQESGFKTRKMTRIHSRSLNRKYDGKHFTFCEDIFSTFSHPRIQSGNVFLKNNERFANIITLFVKINSKIP
jgi:hypothetical protein